MLLTMLGCFNPNLSKIWTIPNVGLKMSFQILTQLLTQSNIFLSAFLTQHTMLKYNVYLFKVLLE